MRRDTSSRSTELSFQKPLGNKAMYDLLVKSSNPGEVYTSEIYFATTYKKYNRANKAAYIKR